MQLIIMADINFIISIIISFISLIFLTIALNVKRMKIKKRFYPNVSVLSWAWRDGNIIERKIKNFLSLKYPGKYEVIIIDNNSKDETKEICRKYIKKGLIKYYKAPKEYDRKAFALDEAIKKVSKYDILAMTDPDGICEKSWLTKIVQPFQNKNVGAVIGLTHCGNFYKNLFTKLRAVEDEWNFVISPMGRVFGKSVQLTCGANYAVRRTALKDVNYHGKKTLGEDFELTVKLYNKNWDINVADANVYQEEVEGIKQYFRQRFRWIDSAFRVPKHYSKQTFNIIKKRSIGWLLFVTSFMIPIFSLIFLLMMFYGLFFSPKYLNIGLLSFFILNLSILIGLIKFKKKFLMPYIPLYLIIEPFLIIATLIGILYIKFVGKKVEWRSLFGGYYHSGSKILLK